MENDASAQSSISPLMQRFAPNFGALYHSIFSPKSPRSPSLYSSASSDDRRSTTTRSAMAMEHRARLVLEYPRLCDPYDRRPGHDLTEEIDLLAQLRLASSDLAMQSCFRRLGLSDANSTGPDFSSESVCNYSPSIVSEQSGYEKSDPKRVRLPKIRSSGYLKLNQAAASYSRSSPPVSTGTRLLRLPRAQKPAIVQQSDYLSCGKKGQEALEFEAYAQGMLKMELCNKWIETGTCPYGDHYQFAHATAELRPVIRHPCSETEVCRMFLAGYTGPYSHRDQLNRPGGKKEQEALEFESYSQGMLKTELWNKWKETDTCPYDDHCRFAHGIAELHVLIRHPHYENCRMFLAGYPGPYGHSNEEEPEENEDDSDNDENYPDKDEDDSGRYRSEDMCHLVENKYDNKEENIDCPEEEKEEEKEDKEESEDDKVALVDSDVRVFTIYRIIPKREFECHRPEVDPSPTSETIASIQIEQLCDYSTFAAVVHEEWKKLLGRPQARGFNEHKPWPLFNCTYYTTHGDHADSRLLSWEDFKRSATVAKMEEEGIIVYLELPRDTSGWAQEYCERDGVYLDGQGPWDRIGKVYISELEGRSALARVLHMVYAVDPWSHPIPGVKEYTVEIDIGHSWPGCRVRLVGQGGTTLNYRNEEWSSLSLALCRIQVEYGMESDTDEESCGSCS